MFESFDVFRCRILETLNETAIIDDDESPDEATVYDCSTCLTMRRTSEISEFTERPVRAVSVVELSEITVSINDKFCFHLNFHGIICTNKIQMQIQRQI